MTAFWVSFWIRTADHASFEYHGPWWISGMRDGENDEDEDSIVAAVMAEDGPAARRVLEAAFDPGHHPTEWRFCEPRAADWNPLKNVSGRFEPRPWMKWPWPAAPEVSL